ncbi:uncharacterized protein L3040_005329 [Drepanopeziza brunnea f. sp. 'multigermtubi']|uniref:HIG1 domain-containing protein n=1 Tax=Marssonina brunnea f. sp. multigermtubi (strain MB_m1) TaxID=1072389 RepID=K1X9Q6_MARBU|nr:uncharacterized protein MBM_00929 [Drepanopeziza brunnea f. sp. 'multigermtubi' MB_m1]EKD21816.1 hypothetical protein MBM_00929 [Drepanopeziza brunnea f. sp. 'multigermtubi' MB_m1]KAJ5041760.1 hypothetical protein L3040_005329 [Drepanopeziza brunnea f. sp. 'multigermtubi']
MSNSPLPSSFDGDTEFYEENRWQKLFRRLKEEPLIPLGCGLTCWALFNASRSIRAGDSNRTNRMFRARIYAQAFTLLAMLGGSMYWKTDRQKRKEFDDVLAEQKAQEKRAAWIRELESRDAEEKELKAERRRKLERLEKRKEELGRVEKGKEGAGDKSEKGVVDKGQKSGADEVVEQGKEASSVVRGEEKKGVLESVSGLLWPKK